MSDVYFAFACFLTGFSQKKLAFLLEKARSFERIWEASEDELISFGLTPEEAKRFLLLKENCRVDDYWAELQKKKINILTLSDSHYPSLLKEIDFPPLVLFYQGLLPKTEKPWVGIVGSRLCSSRGKNLAKELSLELSKRGFIIVSGLARGIDTFAHLGALEGKGKTVAVLGCGLDVEYPPENKSLKKRIAEEGLVLTEFLPGTEPLAYNFPQRNRIIAGLSKAVIVVEARLKSGALITAHLAADYGREVMAFPGNPENPYARGCNQLIKEGAFLVESLEEVLEVLGFAEETTQENVFFDLSEDEEEIVKLLEAGVQQTDEIIRTCGQKALSLLTLLEVKGVVSRQAGQIFSLNHRLKKN